MSIEKDLKRIKELVKIDPGVEETEEVVSWIFGIVKDSMAYRQIVEVLAMEGAVKNMPFETVDKLAQIVGVEPDEAEGWGAKGFVAWYEKTHGKTIEGAEI